MKNKKANGVFTSFKELGAALGFDIHRKNERKKVCKWCNSEMKRLSGTNVYVCTGTNKSGTPCESRLIVSDKRR